MLFDYKSGLKIEYYGESHTKYIGVKASGIKKGIKVDFADMQAFLSKRKGGKIGGTNRVEEDCPIIISGIEDGFTNGDTIEIQFENKNYNDNSYKELEYIPRPSTADYPAMVKYREKYILGGGKFSARLTVLTCAIGYILLEFLKEQGINICAHVYSVGNICNNSINTLTGVIDDKKGFYSKVEKAIKKAGANGDTLGGIIECVCSNVKVGVGGSDFEGLEGVISKSIFSIPSVKGIEFGSGFNGTKMLGSQNNDQITIIDNKISTTSNNAGGILGGMANGMPIIFKVAFKPIPSIRKKQFSVDLSTKKIKEIVIGGRHDICGVLRATPIVESATAIAIYSQIIKEEKRNSLESVRDKIDIIDSEIASLLVDRIEAVKKISEIKKNKLPIEDTYREKEIIDRLAKNNPQAKEYIENIYREIFTLSKKAQEKK